jgi:hypothetical protein
MKFFYKKFIEAIQVQVKRAFMKHIGHNIWNALRNTFQKNTKNKSFNSRHHDFTPADNFNIPPLASGRNHEEAIEAGSRNAGRVALPGSMGEIPARAFS